MSEKDELDIGSVAALRVFGEWGVETPWWPHGARYLDGESWYGALDAAGACALGLSEELIADGIAWRAEWERIADQAMRTGEEPDVDIDAIGEDIALRTSCELREVDVEGPTGTVYLSGRGRPGRR